MAAPPSSGPLPLSDLSRTSEQLMSEMIVQVWIHFFATGVHIRTIKRSHSFWLIAGRLRKALTSFPPETNPMLSLALAISLNSGLCEAFAQRR